MTDVIYLFLAFLPAIVGISGWVLYYWWYEWKDYPKELRWP